MAEPSDSAHPDIMAYRPSQSNADHSDLLKNLICQPAEIISKVLLHLDVKELLGLRQVNHTLHDLLHEHEAGLCSSYCRTLGSRNRALPVAAAHGNARDLVLFIDLKQRYDRMWDLADILSNHFISCLHQEGVTDKALLQDLREKKRPLLHKALFPALFMLDHFLQCLRMVMTDAEEAFSQWADDEYLSAVDVFMLDQQRIIENLARTSHDIVDMLAAWKMLQAACVARKIKFTLKAPEYPFANVKRLVVYYGLRVFGELLTGSPDVAIRRNLLSQMSSRIWNTRNGGQGLSPRLDHPLLDSIHHLDVSRHRVSLPTQRPYRVVNKFFERQEILSHAAFAVLQRQEGSSNPDHITEPIPWMISRFHQVDQDQITYTFSDYTAPTV